MDNKAKSVVLFCGLALVAGFFLPWVSVGGFIKVSGWDMVAHGDGFSQLAIALIPLTGLVLVVAALGNARAARASAFFVGGGILTYFVGSTAWAFLKTTGLGLWLVLAAAIVALGVGLASRRSNS
jgi:hypothetical protein